MSKFYSNMKLKKIILWYHESILYNKSIDNNEQQ